MQVDTCRNQADTGGGRETISTLSRRLFECLGDLRGRLGLVFAPSQKDMSESGLSGPDEGKVVAENILDDIHRTLQDCLVRVSQIEDFLENRIINKI